MANGPINVTDLISAKYYVSTARAATEGSVIGLFKRDSQESYHRVIRIPDPPYRYDCIFSEIRVICSRCTRERERERERESRSKPLCMYTFVMCVQKSMRTTPPLAFSVWRSLDAIHFSCNLVARRSKHESHLRLRNRLRIRRSLAFSRIRWTNRALIARVSISFASPNRSRIVRMNLPAMYKVRTYNLSCILQLFHSL